MLSHDVGALTSRLGARVEIDACTVSDRSAFMPLRPPGIYSANGAAKLVRTGDGWVAVNLARPEDLDLLPAWLGVEAGEAPWDAIDAACAGRSSRAVAGRARLLGLPVARPGETRARRLHPRVIRMPPAGAKRPISARLRVIDLSSLWAGPLCGAVFADAGAEVIKVESRARPDGGHALGAAFFAHFNRNKGPLTLDFADADDLFRLREMIFGANVLITSARARAFAGLGLTPAEVFSRNPSLTWVAITGHGFCGARADRVAFGDDAAVAGGLVVRDAEGKPRFFGDAAADPVTGLAAAVGGLKAVLAGGGALVDAAMARASAGALHA